MPAYFNMSLVFERKDIQPNFTRDVHNLLHKAGFIFKSGCFEAEKYSLEEILCWNQKHLENNFHLGFTEHPSVKMIQTGLESSDAVVSLNDIQAGASPNAYPFAIVPNGLAQKLSRAFCVEK